MKNARLYGWLLALSLVFFASACEKEDPTPTPDPTPNLQTVLAGKYWESNAYFLHRSSTGEETVDRSTLSNLRIELGVANDPRSFLGVFYCAPTSRRSTNTSLPPTRAMQPADSCKSIATSMT